jgi:hypothetical protein
MEEYELDKPKRTFDPANRLAHGVVVERRHAQKYFGTQIFERVVLILGTRGAGAVFVRSNCAFTGG